MTDGPDSTTAARRLRLSWKSAADLQISMMAAAALAELRQIAARVISDPDRYFVPLLATLFLCSFLPFLFPPSLALTAVLSAPPFLLIYWRARTKRRALASEVAAETECASAFVSNAESYWARIRSRPDALVREEDVLGLVPQETRRASVHMKIFVEDIAKAKLSLIDTPRDVLLRPYKERLEQRYGEIATYGNLAIRLGILGTFCGFILALSSLASIFVNFGLHQQLEFGTILQNLAYSFVKSTYGLGTAVLIGIAVSRLREPLERFYRLFDESLAFGREFVGRMTLADPAMQSSLLQIRNSLKQVEDRLYNHSIAVADAMREHGNKISDEVSRFDDAADGLIQAQDKWNTAFKGMESAGDAFERKTSEAFQSIEAGMVGAAANFESMLKSLNGVRFDLAEIGTSLRGTSHQSEDDVKKALDDLLTLSADSIKAIAETRHQWASLDNHMQAASHSAFETMRATQHLAGVMTQLEQNFRAQGSSVAAGRSRAPWQLNLIAVLLLLIAMVLAAAIAVSGALPAGVTRLLTYFSII